MIDDHNKPAAHERTFDTPAGRLPDVLLVAHERGFYNGAMVEVGQQFMFDPNSLAKGAPVGTVRALPKWAAPPAANVKPKSTPLTGYDTKPLAAQLALKKKTGLITGGT